MSLYIMTFRLCVFGKIRQNIQKKVKTNYLSSFFLLFSGTTFLQNLYMVYIPTKRIVIHENLVENVLHFPKYTQNDFFLQTIV